MILDEMNIAFLTLRERYRTGQVSSEEFIASIDKLRLVSSDGKQWRINHNGQGWVYWDETYWELGNPRTENNLKPEFENWKTLLELEDFNETALQYLLKLVKGLSINFVKSLPKKVLKAVITIFVINALINWVYETTDFGQLGLLRGPLQSKASLITRFLYYYAMTIITVSVLRNKFKIAKLIPDGIRTVMAEGLDVLSDLKNQLPSLVLGNCIALGVGSLVDTRTSIIALLIVVMMAITTKEKSQLIYFIKLVQHDLKQSSHTMALAWGLIDGFVISFILGSLVSYVFYASIILLIGVIVMNSSKKEA
jgi:hypothetical protein